MHLDQILGDNSRRLEKCERDWRDLVLAGGHY